MFVTKKTTKEYFTTSR